MTGLVEFLRARLNEDEQDALPFRNPQGRAKRWQCDETGGKVRQVGTPEFGLPDVVSESDTHLTAVHIARWDPARVLADVAAKRAIIDLHEGSHECSTYRHGEVDNCTWCIDATDCSTLLLLAAPFVGHPEFDPDWTVPGEAS